MHQPPSLPEEIGSDYLATLPASERLAAYLQNCDERFDSAVGMLRQVWKGAGYHTTVPNGTVVHPTVSALSYVLALVEEGSPTSIARAEEILGAVLPLQDRDPVNTTYGIWPWMLEEPISAMRPPDWNWADFCGIRLVHLLGKYRRLLGRGAEAAVEDAAEAAAYSIFRRNVGPWYTNIAVKGAIMTAVAGEQLGNAMLLQYGKNRLASFLQHTSRHGGFNEYNSPGYELIVLGETERGLALIKDEEMRQLLGRLHAETWRQISIALHLPTGQLAPPQSRTYSDCLQADAAAMIGEGLGIELFRDEMKSRGRGIDSTYLFLVPRLPCPPAIKESILAHEDKERFMRQQYVAHEDPDATRVGTVWMDSSACLGSVNSELFWTQRRPVMAYWRIGNALAILRLRMKHDGKDFSSGVVRTQQKGREVLALCSFALERGDFHPELDRPKDGVFPVSDLCVSLELTAPGAAVEEIRPGVFTLRAGNWRATVQPAVAMVEDFPIGWECSTAGEQVIVRAVVNEGKPLQLEPAKIAKAAIGFHVALRKATESDPRVETYVEFEPETISVLANSSGCKLEVSAPLKPRIHR